jgi:uncharacterized membrane protein YfcA
LDVTIPGWPLLAGAALAAGILNAVAGGGSFLTFPALVFTGVPPIAANATSAVVLSPGYLGSVLGFRAELGGQRRARLWREGILSGAGGIAGALLLLATPARMFSRVVPWLILFATLAFVMGPRLVAYRARTQGAGDGDGPARPAAESLGLFAIAVYGGYFNGGLGILLMALYALTGVRSVHTANALKIFDSFVLSLVSVSAFIWAGIVHWPQAAVMIPAATLGGFLGARLALRLPAAWVRGVVVAAGLVMAALFFLKT